MNKNLGITGWHLESNSRGHWLAFDATENAAMRLVDALSGTPLGVRTWGESFRAADDGVSYNWYLLLKFRGNREVCLRALHDLLDAAVGDEGAQQGDGQPESKSIWQRVLSILPWVHEESTGASDADSSQAHDDFDDDVDEHNSRPVHQLHVTFETGAWPTSGVLRELGYKVGRSGLGPEVRRRILRNALTVTLVASTDEARPYIEQWGAPKSRGRADKIERCLSNFAETARRRSADMSDAIADWEADLDWFRVERNRLST